VQRIKIARLALDLGALLYQSHVAGNAVHLTTDRATSGGALLRRGWPPNSQQFAHMPLQEGLLPCPSN
jgi:hypothetical protein